MSRVVPIIIAALIVSGAIREAPRPAGRGRVEAVPASVRPRGPEVTPTRRAAPSPVRLRPRGPRPVRPRSSITTRQASVSALCASATPASFA